MHTHSPSLDAMVPARRCAWLLGLMSLAMPSTALSQQSLADFVLQFQTLDSVHIHASVDLRILDNNGVDLGPAGEGEVIEGAFSYWASGEKYRIDSHMDPDLYPGMMTSIAFDGENFQMLLGDSQILAVSSQDTDRAAMMLPNPIAEMLQFLYPLTDENLTKRVRLKDIQTNDTLIAQTANVAWMPHEQGVLAVEHLERAIFPGGTYAGIEYEHHVYVQPGKRHRPIRIERVAHDGMVLTRTHLSHYDAVQFGEGVAHWPRHIVLEGYNPNAERAGYATFIILNLKLNEPIDDSIFTLDREGKKVWDEDALQYID